MCVIMCLFWPNQGLFFFNPKGMFCGFKLKLKLLHMKRISGVNFFSTK